MNYFKKRYQEIACALYNANGKKPWSIGYNAYKQKQINKAINRGDFNAHKLPARYGFRLDERIVEYPWVLNRLPENKGKLLDAGSTLNFDFLISHEKLAKKKLFISTLAPEKNCFWKKGTSYVYEDLRETCYKDDYFDWIVSISTIEHIGLDNTRLYTKDALMRENNRNSYLLAIKELHRVLKPGGVVYVSLPFGKRKDHGWFQVFDDNMVDRLIKAFSPSSVIETHFRYEPDGWRISSRDGSKNATYFDIHQQRKYDADYAAAARAVVCLELKK